MTVLMTYFSKGLPTIHECELVMLSYALRMSSSVIERCLCRLGLHLTEIAAAKAYDRVAIKKWGAEEASSKINFPLDQYNLAELDAMDMQELVTMVRGISLIPFIVKSLASGNCREAQALVDMRQPSYHGPKNNFSKEQFQRSIRQAVLFLVIPSVCSQASMLAFLSLFWVGFCSTTVDKCVSEGCREMYPSARAVCQSHENSVVASHLGDKFSVSGSCLQLSGGPRRARVWPVCLCMTRIWACNEGRKTSRRLRRPANGSAWSNPAERYPFRSARLPLPKTTAARRKSESQSLAPHCKYTDLCRSLRQTARFSKIGFFIAIVRSTGLILC